MIDYLTTQEAETLDGALVQLALAVHFFNWLGSTELDRPSREKTIHRIRHLKYSASSVLQDIVDAEALLPALNRYMAPHQDPWKAYKERIATFRE